MRIVITVGGSIIIRDHDYKKFSDYANVLRSMAEEHQILVVVGGGRTARDYIGIARDLDASEALCDDIGIEVTRLNARLLITALKDDAYPRVPHNFSEALEFSTSGKIVVMGGTEPAHSTDAVGSILAEFVGADLLLNATSVDGLFDKDPNKYSDAKMYSEITPRKMMELLSDKEMRAGTYEFLDKTAIQIIGRSRIKTVIFNGETPENLKKALKEKIGTLIVPNPE
ncbi:UMP kinase [Methanobacterium petrolearium]|uniref:UMP kinase n=1 Tax=Methanobacterium petrolearium TaxID=710190 RepID=UPI001AE1FC81|nr:UMP kinase [Methanobacterium petrolearium]MBP1946363.1 uridylate kinase [Methanobacterium petrolearium]BDZ70617.1 uridylate kinase [Methanobacterium petrolearium]